MNKLQKMIAKIKSLLALATSPNEHEAASAAEKAASLLAEHNLSMTDIEKPAEPIIDFDPELLMVPEVWRRLLGKSLGQLYFSHYAYAPTNGQWDAHGFVGQAHNVTVAKLMFVYVVKAVVMRAQEAASKRPEKGRKEYYSSFAMAAAMRINARIQKRLGEATRGTMTPGDPTTLPALVSLYERTSRDLALFVEQQLGAGAEKQQVEITDSKGAHDGTIAGNQIGLDTQIGNHAAPERLQ
jgi:hypothetical protein